jgi:hypothetical protein
MRAAALAILVAAGLGASAFALAQAPQAPAADGPDRYALTSVAGGFLRLDRRTGRTDFCASAGDAGYACRPAAEDASAAGDRVAALERRVAELEAKLAGRLVAPQSLADAPRDPTLALPTDEQVDRVASFLERALKRFKRLAAEAEADGGGSL